jgi:type I restriction enzyme, S subunit
MGVRSGYKQTELGVIPEDWEVKTISDVASVKTGPFGSALHERDYVLDGTPIITVEHLSENGVIHKNLPLVSDADKIRLKSYILRKNDIVFSRVGSVDRNSLISKTENGWLFSGRLLRVRTSNKNIHPPYLSYFFHSETFKKRVRNVAVGQTMASLNTQILNGISVVLPPFIEQRAIATALSDVDGLIESLDKLIAKKRDIKQAAMQELLTGKKRLPGFNFEWNILNMSKHSTLKARIGWQGLTTAEYLKNGQYALVTGTNFVDDRIDWNNCYFVEKERYDQDKNIQLQSSDILLTKDGTIGKTAFVENLNFPATLNSGVFVIRPKENKYNPKYFFYVLTSFIFKRFLKKLQAGSTIFHLYQKDFASFEFLAPDTIKEQTAIAEILSDMDAEIETLEKKLTKTRLLKRGMMQELLTGKTRLI